MNISAGELKARHNFVETSVAGAMEIVARPEVQQNLGAVGKDLTNLLGSVVVPNVIDGVVQIPRSHKNRDVLPMLALKPGEDIALGGDFTEPTTKQREIAAKTFDAWDPADHSGAELLQIALDEFFANRRDDIRIPVGTGERAAITAAIRSVFGLHNPELGFRNLPAKKVIGSLITRPLVALTIADSPIAEPDLLAHELTHVLQKTLRPVEVFGSQRDIDKTFLRYELEAYHLGAVVRLNMPNAWEDPNTLTDGHIQLAVEALRRKANDGLHDPFLPTPALRHTLDRHFGIERVVHQPFDYDAAVQAVCQ